MQGPFLQQDGPFISKSEPIPFFLEYALQTEDI